MPKHYIRLDEDKNIIKIFCTDFEEPESKDICILKNAPRHINSKTLINGLKDDDGKYNYKYVSKKITERTDNEKWTQADKDEKEKDELIQDEIMLIQKEQAIQNLKDKNILDINGNLIK